MNDVLDQVLEPEALADPKTHFAVPDAEEVSALQPSDVEVAQ
jgi:hypothetical protein